MPGFFLERKIETIEPNRREYPEALKKIAQPPEILYYKGDKSLLHQQCLAIVGTRRASDYGKEIAFQFAKELAEAGLVIVSGMALGVDSLAHQGALAGKGRTIAVLGTGLEEKTIYPQSNLGLAKKILDKGGLLLSEYPPDYPGSKHTFLKRNRLISGLSLGVLVVEAKYRSGALNTAFWAKKQGKAIFAIPGSVYSLNSQGTNRLIQQGGQLVQKPNEILKALKIKPEPNRPSPLRTGQAEQGQASRLIIYCLAKGALSIDKIIEKTKLSPSETAACLSLLEIEEKVKNLGGNTYALSR